MPQVLAPCSFLHLLLPSHQREETSFLFTSKKLKGMSKNRKKIFCQSPFELENDERIRRMDRLLPDSGFGVFIKIRNRISRGGGAYALSGIMSELTASSQKRRRRVERVLTEFDLFVVEDGMVRLAPGLTVKEMYPRGERTGSPSERLKKVQESMSRGYDEELFPEEMQRMDAAAAAALNEEIRSENQKALEALG